LFDVFRALLRVFRSLQACSGALPACSGALYAATPALRACYFIIAARELSIATTIDRITVCYLHAACVLQHLANDLLRLAIALTPNCKLQCTIVRLQRTIVELQCAGFSLQRAVAG
jgi:hypothetical protein